MLGSKIKACKPPQNDLKSGQRHRHDLSLWRWVLGCPSKTKKMRSNHLAKVQNSGFVWGHGLYQMEGIYFSGFQKAQDVQIISGSPFASNTLPEKNP